MSDLISFNPVRALDANGSPVPGAQAFFYISGTTTPVTVFSDAAEETPHPSPLFADAEGVFPPVFRSGQPLKVDVQTPGGDSLNGFPLDPVITAPASGAAAQQVSFEPTANIPSVNVQAAIEQVQENLVAPLLEGGIGVEGNAEILANVDATDTPSGFYRFTAEASGTLPSELDGQTGIIYLLRRTSADAWQFAGRSNSDRFFMRRLTGGSWQSWNEWVHAGTRFQGLGVPREDSTQALSDINSISPRSGLYRYNSSTDGTFPAGESGGFGYVFIYRAGVDRVMQEIEIKQASLGSNETYRRKHDGDSWSPWQQVSGFGDRYAWGDVTSSRSFGTSYQNTTGKAIMVSLAISTPGGDGGASPQVSTNGSSWVHLTNGLSDNNGKQAYFIVPIGGYYRLRDDVPGFTEIANWAELK